MRIDELTVKNFRCFEDASFRFHPGFNCFTGANGAGKTAILDAIAVALGAWFLGIPWHDGKRPIQYGRQIDDRDVRRVYRKAGERQFDERPQTPVVVTASGEILQQRVRPWTRTRPLGGNTRNMGARHVKQLAEEAVAAINRFEPVTLPLISYYGTARLAKEQYDTRGGDAAILAEADQPLHGYRASLDPRWNSKDLVRWLLRQQWIAFQEGRASATYEVVNSAILGCLDGAKHIDFVVASGMAMIEFGDTGWRPFSELSDGQRNIFAMIGDLAQKASVLNPHLGDRVLAETPGVVLIDELDLHLHPSWQRRIVQDLQRTFPRLQFFVSTHSPQIIGELEPDKVVVLHRIGLPEPVRQSYGFDSGYVLRTIMGASARPEAVQDLITQAEEQIDDEQFAAARETLERLRELLRGDDPETVGLEASLNTLEALRQ
jgi:predicted ATP-binding protein involved in virulence